VGSNEVRGQPFFREGGSGPAVVCLHSNASSSSQWRALMDRLAPRFRVIAPDSYGAGKTPPGPSGRSITLHDEVALLEPVFAHAGKEFVLVGHSYGGAIALIAALAHPRRVTALALYEPTMFSLVNQREAPPNDTVGIETAVAHAAAALDRGDEDAAAAHFIDFWMGKGMWAAMPEPRKPAITAAIRHVRDWRNALMNEPTPIERFADIKVPVLLMTGRRTPASGPAAARMLRTVLKRCETAEFAELGHMGPLTHPDAVNATIEDFLMKLGLD
jgi:pimeloyl-ACP methyl ester carboxylesterase